MYSLNFFIFGLLFLVALSIFILIVNRANIKKITFKKFIISIFVVFLFFMIIMGFSPNHGCDEPQMSYMSVCMLGVFLFISFLLIDSEIYRSLIFIFCFVLSVGFYFLYLDIVHTTEYTGLSIHNHIANDKLWHTCFTHIYSK